MEELEYWERVDERKDWLRGWLGLLWGRRKGRESGDEFEDDGDEGGVVYSMRSEKGLGRLFRRRGNWEERWDEEMGMVRLVWLLDILLFEVFRLYVIVMYGLKLLFLVSGLFEFIFYYRIFLIIDLCFDLIIYISLIGIMLLGMV